MERRGCKVFAHFSFSPNEPRPGWNWHLTLKPKFNRLPWRHRASPSTTRYESVKSTDADIVISKCRMSNGFFQAAVCRSLRQVEVQPRSEPAFHFSGWFALSPGEIVDLLALQLADGEVFGLRMGELKIAALTGGPSGEALHRGDAGVFLHVEQLTQQTIFSVVWARGVPGSGTDAAWLPDPADQIVYRRDLDANDQRLSSWN